MQPNRNSLFFFSLSFFISYQKFGLNRNTEVKSFQWIGRGGKSPNKNHKPLSTSLLRIPPSDNKMAVSSCIVATKFSSIRSLQFCNVVSCSIPSLSFQARDKGVNLGCSAGSFSGLFVVNSSSSTASLNTHQGIWEHPDDGSGSEYDEEEEEEMEENLESGFQEGNNVGVVDQYAGNNYEEDLVKGLFFDWK